MYQDGTPITGGLYEFSKKCRARYSLYPSHELLVYDKANWTYKFSDLAAWEQKVAEAKSASKAKAKTTVQGSPKDKNATLITGTMATCNKCKSTCAVEFLDDPHCLACGAMLPNEGLTKELIEQKKLPKEAATAKAKEEAAAKPENKALATLKETRSLLDTMQDSEDNTQLKDKLDEKIQALEAEQAMPESTAAKKKDQEELLNIKSALEKWGEPSKEIDNKIKKLQADINGDGQESRTSRLKTLAQATETLRKNRTRLKDR